MDKEMARRILEGEVVRPVSGLKVTIKIDPAALRRLNETMEALKHLLVGHAFPISRQPDERNIIDQD
jgi:hypothetical protein